LATVVIMRDNRPFAQIVPMQKRRTIKKLPSLACKVDFADLCSDDSKMWDACNA
jgi:antitoxin (DNA-binding transcriptional repressor) of toxin-antitoxin stability system